VLLAETTRKFSCRSGYPYKNARLFSDDFAVAV